MNQRNIRFIREDYLVASGDRNQVVKTTEIDSGQLVYNVSIQY